VVVVVVVEVDGEGFSLVAHPATTEPIATRAAQPARVILERLTRFELMIHVLSFLASLRPPNPKAESPIRSQPHCCAENLRIDRADWIVVVVCSGMPVFEVVALRDSRDARRGAGLHHDGLPFALYDVPPPRRFDDG
jgi:hypothetical protein